MCISLGSHLLVLVDAFCTYKNMMIALAHHNRLSEKDRLLSHQVRSLANP